MALCETATEVESLPLERGLAALRAGRHAEAAELLRQGVRREPGRLAAVRGLATALLCANEGPAAREVLAGFNRDYPMSADGWVLTAQLHWKLRECEDAVRVLRDALALLPHSTGISKQLAVYLGATGQAADARVAIEAGESTHVRTLVDAACGQDVCLGAVFARPTTGEAARADDDWLDRVAQSPRLIDTVLELSAGQYDDDMFRELARRLASLTEAQPAHADRWLALARLWTKLDQDGPALAACERAVALRPDWPDACRLKATLLAERGDVEQALRVLAPHVRSGALWPDVRGQIASINAARPGLARDAGAASAPVRKAA